MSLKARLSHIKPTSWHYRAVTEIWGAQRLLNSKACAYWWVKLPTSLLVYAMMSVLLGIIWGVGWFAGYHPNFHDGPRPNYPYKERPDGTRVRFAPYQIAIPFAILGMLYYLVVYNPMLGMILLSIGLWAIGTATVIALIVLVLVGLYRIWTSAPTLGIRETLATLWDKACPILVVDEPSDRDS